MGPFQKLIVSLEAKLQDNFLESEQNDTLILFTSIEYASNPRYVLLL